MKRFLTLATTAALVLGSTNAVAFGSTFADINNVPWPGAATFIEEAASLRLMSGYTENGKNAKNKWRCLKQRHLIKRFYFHSVLAFTRTPSA